MLRRTFRIVVNSVVSPIKVVGRLPPFIEPQFKSLSFIPHFHLALPKHQVMNMPALSPTMDKGNIMKWLKKEGDRVEPGDVICEVETDKATVGFEVQEEGFIARILKPEGSKGVSVGEEVAIVVFKQSDVS